MIETRAPGKLYIAGEYAVVEPGVPAVLIAVDRCITVKLTESADAGRVFSSAYGRMPVVWTRDDDNIGIVLEHQPVDYVMAAIDIIERLRGERGLEPLYYDLHIESELDDRSGRKFGLGSSAAVVVATIAAIDEFYELGLSRIERFKVALIATAAVSPRGSGGDLAASTFGGWIRYTAPDRLQLLDDLAQRTVTATLDSRGWEPFSVTQLPQPGSFELLVGWTGSPASTERLVTGVERKNPSSDPRHGDFLVESSRIVDGLVEAIQRDDVDGTLGLIREARGLLQALGEATGICIETDKLRTLCETAERRGAAAKPSGAGGGDCGIVLAPTGCDTEAILLDWADADIRRLGLSVLPAEGDEDDR
ncbi:phosphomevalonate kinase [Gulosibacter sp. 10]|uniref:phosphomevalonate kinase n=1 Tax=Gulosibacter sp. 10 TaxID=1255570 RepID=UPI00097E7A9C|nr:phosphomevalonate kinase [Gulosibacter sp. 10]SJM63174.1 Phosphomevalonate kinase [Gulosibacter sp. 10]